ncbi:MAG: hypothetical protein ACE5HP_10895 [Gemmatimonadota bacterium]
MSASPMRRSALVRHLLLPLTLVAWLSACTRWSVRSGPAGSLAAGTEQVRVSLADGSTLLLWEPRAERGSLSGFLGTDRQGRVAIPLAEVTRVETRQVKPAATAGLVVGLHLVGAAVACAAGACDYR